MNCSEGLQSHPPCTLIRKRESGSIQATIFILHLEAFVTKLKHLLTVLPLLNDTLSRFS